MAAKIEITVESTGVTSWLSSVNTIADAVEAGALMARTAMAVRLLHGAAKSTEPVISERATRGENPIYACACGARFTGSSSAFDHVADEHDTSQMLGDEAIRSLAEALVVPVPVFKEAGK